MSQRAATLGISTSTRRATEELEAVVEVKGDLDMVDDRARADTGEGDSVDLVVRSDNSTSMPHANVSQRTCDYIQVMCLYFISQSE